MIVFDTETTGIVKSVDLPTANQPRIIEFYGVKLDHEFTKVGHLHLLFNPQEPLTDEIIRITGITEETLKGSLPFAMHVRPLQRFFLGEEIVVGHNVNFDLDMLFIELKAIGFERKFPWPPAQLCTVEATEHLEGRRLNLSALHKKLFDGENFENAHRAESDVRATVDCLKELVAKGIVTLPGLG